MKVDDQIIFLRLKWAAETKYAGNPFVSVALEFQNICNVGVAVDGITKTVHDQEIDDSPGIFFPECPDNRRCKNDITDGTQSDN